MVLSNIFDPLSELWSSLVNAIPGIAAAIVILFFGYLVASLSGYTIKEILMRTGFDRWLTKTKLNKAIGGASLSVILGTLSKWWVLIAFVASAATSLQLGAISTLLIQLTNWLPNLFVAILISIFGLIITDYASDKIRNRKLKWGDLLGDIVKWTSMIFVILIALNQLGINLSLAENVFIILVSGVVLALALVIGISFGYALRNESKTIIKRLKSRY